MTHHCTVLPVVSQQRARHLCVTVRAGLHDCSVHKVMGGMPEVSRECETAGVHVCIV